MKTALTRLALVIVVLAALIPAKAESNPPECDAFAWSEPVNLGPPINSSFFDSAAALSPNGLSLYFVSARPGGLGSNDIWVSQRRCADCPWEDPTNLTVINSTTA